ncbi:hypothetical protein [Desulfoferrobacter suflitae]|uniref:hypothetical protein n=1 Tax=Desulfoferrobacter suflitae TaxID=2865782 RepID=UPI002164B020|nr:hypothetical protein [Desulfoferrobacter suflitae]MCK8600122.1 hypothetical protein [Desulfoferrobacter suflitae]
MQMFCVAIPAALLDSVGFDVFQDELICVHVYDPSKLIPAPLLEARDGKMSRNEDQRYFQSGLPELMLCTSRVRFLDLFQYFWPISREEFRRMQEKIEAKLAKAKLISDQDVEEIARYLDQNDQLAVAGDVTSAVILTLNDHTVQWASEIVQICRSAKITELVIFKDPLKPPYLCSYPAQQKGFKRPPPIGSKS